MKNRWNVTSVLASPWVVFGLSFVVAGLVTWLVVVSFQDDVFNVLIRLVS